MQQGVGTSFFFGVPVFLSGGRKRREGGREKVEGGEGGEHVFLQTMILGCRGKQERERERHGPVGGEGGSEKFK